MRELLARIGFGRPRSLGVPTTLPIGNSSEVSDSAVEGDTYDSEQNRSSAKRGHDLGLVDPGGTFASGNKDNHHGPKRPKMESTKGQRMVCPYMKHDPVEPKSGACFGPGFRDIHRLKEHLKRQHLREHSCARCGQHFDTTANLHEHNRAPTACEVTHGWQHAGYMTQLQRDDIRKERGQGTTDEERWKAIYKILFPDVDAGRIPSPYHDATGATRRPDRRIDYDEYGIYLRQNLPQRIMAQISLEFQGLDEWHRQRMAEIVQQQSSEILAAFLRDQGATNHTEELPTVGSAEEALVQDGFFLDFLNTTDAVHTDPLGEWMSAD